MLTFRWLLRLAIYRSNRCQSNWSGGLRIFISMRRHLLQAEKGRGEENNAVKSMRTGGEFFKQRKECYQQF
jgi:hypothetical protein